MKVGTLVGFILIVLGVVGLAYGGFTYTKRKETVALGPLEVTATEKESIPISPIVGGILLVAGIAVVMGTRKAS